VAVCLAVCVKEDTPDCVKDVVLVLEVDTDLLIVVEVVCVFVGGAERVCEILVVDVLELLIDAVYVDDTVLVRETVLDFVVVPEIDDVLLVAIVREFVDVVVEDEERLNDPEGDDVDECDFVIVGVLVGCADTVIVFVSRGGAEFVAD